MDGGDDFALGHRLTAADDMAVARILRNQPVLRRGIQRMEGAARLPFGLKIAFFPQRQARLRKPADQLLRNRRRRRQAGRIDAERMPELRPFGGSPHHKIPARQRGAHAGKRADHLPQRQGFHRSRRRAADLLQPFAGNVAVFPAIHLVRGRPDEQIAVHRGGDQHALSGGRRHLEQRVRHQIPRAFIQQQVFAAARYDRRRPLPQHAGDFVGIQPGAVEHIPRLHLLSAGIQAKAPVGLLDALHPEIRAQLHAVVHRVPHGGNGQLIGADDARRGAPQRAGRLFRHLRLQRAHLFPGKQRQPRHTVGKPSLIQPRKGVFVLRGKGQHQRAVVPVRHLQLRRKRRHHRRAAHIEPGLLRSRQRIKPAVDDRTVGAGRSHRHILIPLQQANPQVIAGQLAGGQRADHPGADNHYIIQHTVFLPAAKTSCQTSRHSAGCAVDMAAAPALSAWTASSRVSIRPPAITG